MPDDLADLAADPTLAPPWAWVPDHWNDAGAPPATADELRQRLAVDPTPPPVTPTPVDVAPAPAPVEPQQPGLGIPAAAFDAAVNSPPLPPDQPPPGVPPPFAAAPIGAPPAFPAPAPGPVPSDVRALQHLPFNLAGPPPIAPEPLDTSAAASGGLGGVQEQWAADPLHAPAPVAQEWAQGAAPLDVLEQRRRLEETRQTRLVADQARIEEDNLRQVRADIAARQKADAVTQAKSDQIVADAIKLSQTKVDPGRWMSTRSIGQKLAAYIAVIAGGLYQGRTGGARNIGMDMIQQHIDRDIDAQKADIESGRYSLGVRQNQIAQEFARTGNLYQATQTVRLATYHAAVNKMLTDQQNFDPRGTGWLNYATAIQDMRGRIAQAGESQRKTIFEEEYKRNTQILQLEKQADERWKNRQDVAIAWTKEGREAGKEKADSTVYSPQQLAILNPGLPVPPIPMTQAENTKWLGTQKEGQQAVTAARANTADERARQFGVGEVVDDKGQPVLFRDVAIAGKVADSKGAVDSAVQLVDQIVSARQKYGWSSDLIRSPEWRKMQADYGALVLQKKNTDQLGVLSESDMDLIGKSLGTKDPTEARDPIAGLQAARGNMINNVNAQIRGQAVLPAGRTLKRWEPPPPPAPVRPTPSDRDLELVMAPELDLRADGKGVKERFGNVVGVPDDEPGGENILGSKQLKILDDWYADIRGPDPSEQAQLHGDLQRPADDSLHAKAAKRTQELSAARERALEYLTTAANKSNNHGIRIYAGRLLRQTVEPGIEAAADSAGAQ